MWIPEPFSVLLKRLRLAAGLKQSQLGELSGIRASRISQVECGRREPSEEEIRALLKVLNVNVRDIASHAVLEPQEGKEQLLARCKKERPGVDTQFIYPVYQRILDLRRNYPELTLQLMRRIDKRQDRIWCWRWLGLLPSDSADEFFPWLHLLARHDTLARITSLEQAGFDTYPVVRGRDRKAELRPCLEVPLNDSVALLFPQVSLRPPSQTVRPDILVELIGRRRRRTCAIEVDGPGHDFSNDRARAAALAFPVEHVEPEDYAAPGCGERLVRYFVRVLGNE